MPHTRQRTVSPGTGVYAGCEGLRGAGALALTGAVAEEISEVVAVAGVEGSLVVRSISIGSRCECTPLVLRADLLTVALMLYC